MVKTILISVLKFLLGLDVIRNAIIDIGKRTDNPFDDVAISKLLETIDELSKLL